MSIITDPNTLTLITAVVSIIVSITALFRTLDSVKIRILGILFKSEIEYKKSRKNKFPHSLQLIVFNEGNVTGLFRINSIKIENQVIDRSEMSLSNETKKYLNSWNSVTAEQPTNLEFPLKLKSDWIKNLGLMKEIKIEIEYEYYRKALRILPFGIKSITASSKKEPDLNLQEFAIRTHIDQVIISSVKNDNYIKLENIALFNDIALELDLKKYNEFAFSLFLEVKEELIYSFIKQNASEEFARQNPPNTIAKKYAVNIDLVNTIISNLLSKAEQEQEKRYPSIRIPDPIDFDPFSDDQLDEYERNRITELEGLRKLVKSSKKSQSDI